MELEQLLDAIRKTAAATLGPIIEQTRQYKQAVEEIEKRHRIQSGLELELAQQVIVESRRIAIAANERANITQKKYEETQKLLDSAIPFAAIGFLAKLEREKPREHQIITYGGVVVGASKQFGKNTDGIMGQCLQNIIYASRHFTPTTKYAEPIQIGQQVYGIVDRNREDIFKINTLEKAGSVRRLLHDAMTAQKTMPAPIPIPIRERP